MVITDLKNSKTLELTLIDEIYSTLNMCAEDKNRVQNLLQNTNEIDKNNCLENKDNSISYSKCTYETDIDTNRLKTNSSDKNYICDDNKLLTSVNRSKSVETVNSNTESIKFQRFESCSSKATRDEVLDSSLSQNQSYTNKNENKTENQENKFSDENIDTKPTTDCSSLGSCEAFETQSQNSEFKDINIENKTTLVILEKDNEDSLQNNSSSIELTETTTAAEPDIRTELSASTSISSGTSGVCAMSTCSSASIQTSVCGEPSCCKNGECLAERFDGLFFENGWSQRVALSDMVRLNLIGCEVADVISARLMRYNRGIETNLPEVLVPYAEGSSPIAGVLLTEENRKECFNKFVK